MMHAIALGVMSALGLGVISALVLVARLHRRKLVREAVVVTVEPASLIRVLRTEEELEEALRRAASFERRAAETCRSRVSRDESVLEPRPEPGLVAHPSFPMAPGSAA
jgi:hypothetical protein